MLAKRRRHRSEQQHAEASKAIPEGTPAKAQVACERTKTHLPGEKAQARSNERQHGTAASHPHNDLISEAITWAITLTPAARSRSQAASARHRGEEPTLVSQLRCLSSLRAPAMAKRCSKGVTKH
jgi:hypothetical protein